MNSKVRRSAAVVALGVGALALDLAAIRGISASWDEWTKADPVRAVARAGTLVAREVGAMATQRVGDAAMSVALRAVRESGDLFGVIQRTSPAREAVAPPAHSVCVFTSTPAPSPAPVGTSRVDAVVVVSKCASVHGGAQRVEWQKAGVLSRRAL